MNNSYNKYAINKDNCPEKDSILTQNMCDECQYYKGFEMYQGQPCIKCSYFQEYKK